jgi:hypothetical protein
MRQSHFELVLALGCERQQTEVCAPDKKGA